MTRLRIVTAIGLLSTALAVTGCAARRTAVRQALPKLAQGESEPADSYEEAAAFYLLQRAPDGHNLPAERYLAAREHAARMTHTAISSRRSGKSGEREANIGTWTALGPGNIGGRTRALVIAPDNPNVMYAGAAGGGVWKTTDGGQSWQPLTDLLPSIGIGSLAMDPKNSNVLYAGTGEYYTAGGTAPGNSIRGVGVFKTTDGGATWNQMASTGGQAAFYYVNKIVVSPNNSNQLYAATWSGVFSSPDAGVTWTVVLQRVAPNNGCQDLAIRQDQSTDYLFAACGTIANGANAIFRNRDAAGSGVWEQVHAPTGMGRTTLAIAPSNPSTIYAMSANSDSSNSATYGALLAVYRSVSNGDAGTWETRVSNADPGRVNAALLSNPREFSRDLCTGGTRAYLNQGSYDNTLAVDPVNPDVVWAGGVDLFRSDDAGANWGIAAFWELQGVSVKGSHADNHAIAFAPGYNGQDNQTLYAASDGGIYRTDNALAPVATGDSAACPPYNTQVNWLSLNNGYAVTQFYGGAVIPGGAAYFGGSQDNGTKLGTDAAGSNNWTNLFGGDGGSVAVNSSDANIVYAETTYLSMIRSLDGGNTFRSAISGILEPGTNFLFITPFVMDPANSQRLYTGGHQMWQTSDGALSWNAVSTSFATGSGSVSAIAVSTADPNRVYAGTSSGYVYRTTTALTADPRTNWTSSQPRTGYLSSIGVDPNNPDLVYATYSQFKSSPDQNHVYRSTDGGLSWTGIDGSGGSGLPDIPVFSIVPDPQNPSTLYLGTDLGVFVSLDGGNSWQVDDNPFASVPTVALVLDGSAGASNLFAFTHGRGVWRTTLPNSPAACQYQVPASISIPAFGGAQSVGVTTADGCTWSAVANPGSLAVQSPATQSGSGTARFTAPLNTGTVQRTFYLNIQSQQVNVQQDGAALFSGNDELGTAAQITQIPWATVGDTSGLTSNASDPVHSCSGSKDAKTGWWIFTAPSNGTVDVVTLTTQPGSASSVGFVLSAYTVSGQSLGAERGCSKVSKQANPSQPARIRFDVNAGTAYAIEVSALDSTPSDGGNTILTVNYVQ